MESNTLLSQQVLIVARAPALQPGMDGRVFSISKSMSPGKWVIFSDGEGYGQKLAEIITARGDDCLLVSAGQFYHCLPDGHYQIEPTRSEDYVRLFKEVLSTAAPVVKGIVHLWSLDAIVTEQSPTAQLERAQVLSCGSVLHLIQALTKTKTLNPFRMFLITRGAQAVNSALTELSVAQAPLWGLGRVVALEHPELHSVLIDLDPNVQADEMEHLFEELRLQDSENQIAFRINKRHVARLKRAECKPLDHKQPAAGAQEVCLKALFRPDRTYLITGGLGGLGLEVARWMTEKSARHFILVGRHEPTSTKNEEIESLKRMGAEVRVAIGDVSKREDMEKILTQECSSRFPLRGIIHAAGVLDDGVLLQQTWEGFSKVMAAKVSGAWNLHALTQKMSLDFFVLFSSGSSILGSPGQGNHSAANAFLDALAHYRRKSGLPAVSINWGAWDEVGAAAKGNLGQRIMSQGMNIIPIQQGLNALERVMKSEVAQVAVMPIQWSRVMKQFTEFNQPPVFTGIFDDIRRREKIQQTDLYSPDLLRQVRDVPAAKCRGVLLGYVREETFKVLALDPSSDFVDPRQPLSELGLDSLMAVQLRNTLGKTLKRDLPATLLFDYPTIDSLTDFLAYEVLSLKSPEESQPELREDRIKPVNVLDDLEGLSQEEMAVLLAKKIAGIADGSLTDE